jgi:hypothetical protein
LPHPSFRDATTRQRHGLNRVLATKGAYASLDDVLLP